jgi:multiple sugar transport system substrate-binding protein
MSKKTWSTILVVVLVVAAVVGIYFATKPAPVPAATLVPLVTEAITEAPTAAAVVTAAPTATPTVAPTATPTVKPTAVPTATPTVAPTATPTVKPTATPTVKPTAIPTAMPTVKPTAAAVVTEAPAVVAAVATKAPVVAAVATKAPVVAAVATTAPVVAAVAATAPTAAPQTVTAGGKTKATIWHTFTKGQETYLLKAVSDFNASQDKVEILALSQPYQGFSEAVKSAVMEGIGPDIIFNYASEAAGYVKAGLVADLSQYIYDPSIGIKGFDGSLAKGIMDGEVNGFEDGLIHYLPAYTTGPILFYNKTLFEELKLAVPTTWAEFEAAAKVIKEKKNIPALGFDALTDMVQMLIMETPGAGYIDVANKTVLFDTPEVRAKIQWLVDMVKKGYFLLQPSGDYFSSDFNSGIVASYFGSCAGYPYIEPNGFEFAMAPVPADTWYPSWNRGPIVFYYKDDARAQAAYEFVKYFISADVNAGWVEAVTALAPYSWTKDTEAYKAFIAQDTLAVQSLKAVEANLDVAGSLPAVNGANIVRTALQDAVKKAALGEMTVDQAWTEAVKISNAALKGE